MSSIEIAEFENLKTIGIPRCLGFSKQTRPITVSYAAQLVKS